jgi:hypothetical protein
MAGTLDLETNRLVAQYRDEFEKRLATNIANDNEHYANKGVIPPFIEFEDVPSGWKIVSPNMSRLAYDLDRTLGANQFPPCQYVPVDAKAVNNPIAVHAWTEYKNMRLYLAIDTKWKPETIDKKAQGFIDDLISGKIKPAKEYPPLLVKSFVALDDVSLKRIVDRLPSEAFNQQERALLVEQLIRCKGDFLG